MGAPPTFLVRHSMGSRYRLAEVQTLTQDERDTILNALDPARTAFLSASAWVAGHDVELELGSDAGTFQALFDQAKVLNDQVFDVEAALRSSNPDDWHVTTEQISAVQQLANTTNTLWSIIQAGKPGGAQPGLQPGGTDGSGLFFLPPVEPTPGTPGVSPGTALLNLLPAAAAALAPFLKSLPGAPKPGALVIPAVSTGLPWWGWGLLGLGGLGALGIGFAILRRVI